ncbi:MAG: pectinesterase family protein [Opitutaceae bacterium]
MTVHLAASRLTRIAFLFAASFGFVASANAATDANATMLLRGAFPASGATNVNPDTPLRLTFPGTPVLGAGKIQVFDAANNALIEAIDGAVPVASKTIGGLPDFNYTPVIITGNVAEIALRNHALDYGRSYYVTVDAGAFKTGADASAGIQGPQTWRFSTKARAPAPGAARYTIAADGNGDFSTLQAAIDFLPEENTTPTTLFLRKGTYRELIFWEGKHAITLLGEDRKQTIIAYANNERFNLAGGNPFAGAAPDPSTQPRVRGNIYRRGVFLAHRVNDLVVTNLTIRNTTPQGGSQAETIILNGTPQARAILKDLDLYSFQDTLQVNGQAYVTGCYIEGDVDFMWGTGPCYFEECIARSVRARTYFTQIRNRATNHGYVYNRCTFDSSEGVTDNFLSRVAPARFPNSEVVLLDCVLGLSVNALAWQLDGVPREAPVPSFPDIHFWEFNSRDKSGQPVDVSGRLAVSRQLKLPADAAIIANYRNPEFVLGGWNPKSAPIFKDAPPSGMKR